MIGGSWTHLAACACFALGTRNGWVWDGVLWLVSAFLDRADGELARLGNLSTRAGHIFDYYVDNLAWLGWMTPILVAAAVAAVSRVR